MIDLQVRDESGVVLARGARGLDWTQEFIDLDKAVYPMLFGLRAYLDTVFNARQVPLLVAEVDLLPAGAVIPDLARAEIRRLAAMVATGSHLYLWCIGD